MELEATKLELIQWITSLNDLQLIQKLKSIKSSQQDQELDQWHTLSLEEQQGIEEAIASLRNGEGMTWEEVRAGIKNDLGI
jgi:hypothetical protein